MQACQRFQVVLWALLLVFATGCSHSSVRITPADAMRAPLPDWCHGLSAGTGPDTPLNIHLSWRDKPQSSMTITWQTKGREPGTIEYGTTEKLITHESGAGEPHTYAGASGWIHSLTLRGLIPGTRYYYRCGNPLTGWSPVGSFATGVTPGHPFSLVVLGDTYSDDAIRTLVKDAIKTEDIAFTLHTGDLIESGADQTLWDAWFSQMEDLFRRTPILPCLGEKETDAFGFGFAPKYYAQFALPEQPSHGRWYSFDYGDVHFIVLNSEERLFQIAKGSVQYAWLEEDLKASQARWKIVLVHRGPYSAGGAGSDEVIREVFCPLFDVYHVDMVLSGQNHLYERTLPINAGQASEHGTVYVVTAGGGAPLQTLRDAPWVAAKSRTYNYCRIEMTPETLKLKAKGLRIDENGHPIRDARGHAIWEEIDHVTLNKTQGVPCQ